MQNCCGNQPISWRTLIIILAAVLAVLAAWKMAWGDPPPAMLERNVPVLRTVYIRHSATFEADFKEAAKQLLERLAADGCKRVVIEAFADMKTREVELDAKCVRW